MSSLTGGVPDGFYPAVLGPRVPGGVPAEFREWCLTEFAEFKISLMKFMECICKFSLVKCMEGRTISLPPDHL